MRIALIALFALGIFALATAPSALADHCGQGCGCPCGSTSYQHSSGPGHYVGRYPCAPGTYAPSYAPATTYSNPGMVTTAPSSYPNMNSDTYPTTSAPTTYTGTTYPTTYPQYGYRTAYPNGYHHRPYRRSFLGIRW